MDNYFARLNQVNVSEHIERKGSFAYLSWPYAVAQLRLADPAATWEVVRFENLPYLKTEVGYFVEVAVTVQGVRLTQIHPVLDSKNRPILEPSSFDINTSIQRCLVKAIALHGLGLYIYAGEDLPVTERSEEPEAHPAPPALPRISVGQVARLKRAIADTGTDVARLLNYFQIEALEALPASEFDRVLQTLTKSRRKAA